MKYVLFLHILSLLALTGCMGLSMDEDADLIPGTYTRFSRHEFGTEYDTIVISVQNPAAGEFSLLRKWRFERVLDGEFPEPEYKQKATTGIYHSATKLLQETESGVYFSFDVKKKTLFNGTTKYDKL